MRNFIYGSYCNHYRVNKEEMTSPLIYYENFQQFFTREVKPRKIDYSTSDVLSPADSQVLFASEVT